ncbi:MAG TPA: CPBP family intramembrane glutamic endopeptidase [Terracidiphilus sp.]|nr:CPBP family intramembrane glutamic endopeptidase [Terracidiphilus sp.]
MADGTAATARGGNSARTRSKRRAFIEIAIAYVLIMAVIWSPRPLQRYLWLVSVAAVATMMCLSWDGLKAMGLRRENFFRSLWVVGLALVLAAVAVAVAGEMHTLQVHHGFLHIVKTYWAYAVWTFAQQFLMQCFFLLRLLRLLPGPKSAAFATSGLFALAHLPNPILMPVTLLWGFAACLIFLCYRNLYPLGMAHAIFGITIAITVPGPVVHNMRVGLGYMTYGQSHRHAPSMQPQGPDSVH